MRLGFFMILIIISAWVIHDGKKRGVGNKAYLWAVGTFVMLIVFLPVWLVVRPKLKVNRTTEDIDQPKL